MVEKWMVVDQLELSLSIQRVFIYIGFIYFIYILILFICIYSTIFYVIYIFFVFFVAFSFILLDKKVSNN